MTLPRLADVDWTAGEFKGVRLMTEWLSRVLTGTACFILCVLLAAGCATSAKQEEVATPPTPEEQLQREVERLRVVTEQPEASAKDFYDLGNALFDSDDVTEALAAYAECVARDVNYGAAYCNMGLCYRRLGRVADAIAAYDQSLAVDPDNTVTLANAAVALELAGEWERLVEIRATLARLEPDTVRRHSDLGLALVKAERYAEAAEAFEEVLRLDPGYAGDYYNLGLCYFNLEDWDRAVTSWLTALAHNPQNEAVRRGLAVVYWKRGDYAKAWQAVADCQAKGIRMDPDFIAQLQEDSGQLGPE